MSFREKLKKAFRSTSPTSSKNVSPIVVQQEPAEARWPSNVYRPDEPLPRLKYRAPVKKEHKEKLESFKFNDAWRRKSQASLHSPMGSRITSRRGSRTGRSSLSGPSNRESLDVRRKSVAQAHAYAQAQAHAQSRGQAQSGTMDSVGPMMASGSRRHSLDHNRRSRLGQHAAQATSLGSEMEVSGDEGSTEGGVTSTMAFVVPAKSAKVCLPK